MSERIDQFPAATLPLTGTELIPLSQGGIASQTPLSNFLPALSGVPRIVYTLVLNSNIPSITVTGFTTGFNHAILNVYGRGDTAAENTPLLIQFNADIGANYDSLAGGQAATSITPTNLTAATAPANYPGHTQIIIPFFNNTVFYKSTLCFNYGRNAGANAISTAYGLWKSTAAITQATVKVSAGNFLVGSSFTLSIQ